MTKENFEAYFKYIPLGSILLILLSAFTHILYYNQFDINITEYIGISEYISIFIDDAIYDLMPLIILYIILFFVAKELGKWSDKKFNKKTDKEKEETIKNNETERRTRKFTYLAFIFFLIINISYYFWTKEISADTILGLKFRIVALILFTYALIFNDKIRYDLVAIIVLYAASNLFFGALLKSTTIKNNQEEFSHRITFSDMEPIITNDNLKFIGKTSDFIYMYNLKKNQSNVISTKHLVSIKKARKKR